MVTSTSSGLSVPDWPNTYGQFMFSFPFKDMVGGIFYEHGHRMIASFVGFLTIILSFLAMAHGRACMGEKSGWASLGHSGGARNTGWHSGAILFAHCRFHRACTDCTNVFLSRNNDFLRYIEGIFARKQYACGSRVPSLKRLASVAAGAVFIQLLLGAWMRHSDAGFGDCPIFRWRMGMYCRLLPETAGNCQYYSFASRFAAGNAWADLDSRCAPFRGGSCFGCRITHDCENIFTL